MPAATTVSNPLFVELVTTAPGSDGDIVRISASREGEKDFDRLIRGPRLTLGQAQFTGLTNTQLDAGIDLEVVLEDLLEYATGTDAWIVPEGTAARDLFRMAARSAGFPRYPGMPVIGIDDLAAVVLPTVGRRGVKDIQEYYRSRTPDAPQTNPLRDVWLGLKADLLKLPLPLLSEMNWMLARTEHPLKGLLKAAEGEAVNDQFTDTFRSGKLSLDKLFKDFSEIIDRLKPEEDVGGVMASDEPPQQPVDPAEIEKILGPDGPLSKNLQGYEQRPEQIEMAQRAGVALSEGRHLMAEAGTGIGKSLAYLVPSILFAKRAGRPVMISTHTKNLQSQLYEKDLPFLRKHLGIEFEASLLKGRPNYLCLRKFTFTLQESASELDDEDRGRLLPVMTWATQTDSGDVTEMAAFSREQSPELWDRLHTVGDDCLKRQCPFYKRCFVYKARGLTRTADVVVLNHALVFSDLNVESGVLPPYNEIIFDEGHKLEDVATEHLSCEVTPRRIYRILNRLFKSSQGNAAGKGLLPALLNGIEMAHSEFPEPLLTSIKEHILAAIQEIDPANQGSDTFFDTVRQWTDEPESAPDERAAGPFVPMERGRGGATLPPDEFAQPPAQPFGFKRKRPSQFKADRRRFSAQTLRPDETERFTQGKESAISRLGRLRQALEKLEEDYKEIRKRSVPRAREILKELEAQNLFLEELIGDIEFVIKGDEPNYVYWCEPLGRRGARVIAAPLDVSALLHSQLYEKKRSIVITSATLSVRDADADDASGLAPMRRSPGVPPGQPRNLGASPGPIALGLGKPGGTPGLQETFRQGTHLPHWTRLGAVYFVTFRLADSLPQTVLQQWVAERDLLLKRKKDPNADLSAAEIARLEELLSEKFNKYLNNNYGSCSLRDHNIAQVVSQGLQHFHGERYNLHAWSVMPNHVHVVVEPIGSHSLPDILQSWKSYTSKECNRLLNASGQFWQEEYYDHLIRNEKDFLKYVEYTYLNPERAGLLNWAWRGCQIDQPPGTAHARSKATDGGENDRAGRPDYEKPHPKSFEFLKNRLGLNLCSKEKLDELLLGSPFDYDKQCRLYVPTFIPEPGGAREKDFTAAFTDMLSEVIVASGGRAMVLYTSYTALEASATILRKTLTPQGIEVIAQGSDGSRESLLARLKEGGRTALLGTASFWEGVDVRGEALSLLVIAKLPFAVFTDPVIQGRCELLEASGKDPFLHFSVPQAILKLRQGFGRLIRSKADRGVVILADKRVLTKRYGAAFLRALPAQARAIANCDTLAAEVREFLA